MSSRPTTERALSLDNRQDKTVCQQKEQQEIRKMWETTHWKAKKLKQKSKTQSWTGKAKGQHEVCTAAAALSRAFVAADVHIRSQHANPSQGQSLRHSQSTQLVREQNQDKRFRSACLAKHKVDKPLIRLIKKNNIQRPKGRHFYWSDSVKKGHKKWLCIIIWETGKPKRNA